jgi:hypothetical protein
MKIYQYDAETGEYLREVNAIPNPFKPDLYLDQPNTTQIPPLEPKVGYAVMFDDGWKYVEDNRGKLIFDCKNGNNVGRINSITEYLLEGFTFEMPNQGDVWTDGRWQPKPPPTIEEMEALQKAQIQKAFQDEVYPLMLQSFIGELDRQVVLDKMEEIRQRFEVKDDSSI